MKAINLALSLSFLSSPDTPGQQICYGIYSPSHQNEIFLQKLNGYRELEKPKALERENGLR